MQSAIKYIVSVRGTLVKRDTMSKLTITCFSLEGNCFNLSMKCDVESSIILLKEVRLY